MITKHTTRFLGLALAACFGLVSCKPTESSTPDADAQVGGDWHFEFAELRAYRMNWEDAHSFDKIMNYKGELNETRMPKEGLVLSPAQVDQLAAAVTGEHPEHPMTECFYPHHAFLFYDKDCEIVGQLDVCFKCSKFIGEPEGFAKYGDFDALKSLFGDIGMPIRNENWED